MQTIDDLARRVALLERQLAEMSRVLGRLPAVEDRGLSARSYFWGTLDDDLWRRSGLGIHAGLPPVTATVNQWSRSGGWSPTTQVAVVYAPTLTDNDTYIPADTLCRFERVGGGNQWILSVSTVCPESSVEPSAP